METGERRFKMSGNLILSGVLAVVFTFLATITGERAQDHWFFMGSSISCVLAAFGFWFFFFVEMVRWIF